MKIPPHDNNFESFVPTVEVDGAKTLDVGSVPTVDLGVAKTELIDHGRISLNTLVRARAGARDSAFEECKRTCRIVYLSWRRGVITGALVMASGVVAAVGAVWTWAHWRPQFLPRIVVGAAIAIGSFTSERAWKMWRQRRIKAARRADKSEPRTRDGSV